MGLDKSQTKVEIFLPLYVGDYDRDTADLSFEEHGFYLAILRALWVREGVLHLDDRQRLARILRTDVATLDRLWPSVARFFTVTADGKTFSQKRLSTEMEKAKCRKADASRAGQASADARRFRAGTAQPSRTLPRTPVRTDVEQPPERSAEPDIEPKTNTSPSPSPSPSESPKPGSGAPAGFLGNGSERAGANAPPSGSDVPGSGLETLRLFERLWVSRWQMPWRPGKWDPRDADTLFESFPKGPSAMSALAEIKSAMEAYLRSEDPRYVKLRHPFSLFARDYDAFRRAPEAVQPRPQYAKL